MYSPEDGGRIFLRNARIYPEDQHRQDRIQVTGFCNSVTTVWVPWPSERLSVYNVGLCSTESFKNARLSRKKSSLFRTISQRRALRSVYRRGNVVVNEVKFVGCVKSRRLLAQRFSSSRFKTRQTDFSDLVLLRRGLTRLIVCHLFLRHRRINYQLVMRQKDVTP